MNAQALFITASIILWAIFIAVMIPGGAAKALYRTRFGRVWDGLVRVMDRGWAALVRRER